jgi:hypothetical protein
MFRRARVSLRSALIAGLAAVWLGAACAGLGLVAAYANRPGIDARAPRRWPEGSRLVRDPTRANLVMLVHPGCPCSRASLEELDRMLARSRGRVAAHVVFLKPSELPDGWERTDLWQRAASIPGVRVWRDDGGEVARFGAATSGQVVLYDATGALLFSGGITPSRGHEGDNAGRDTVVALLEGRRESTTRTPVFGCSLRDPGGPGAIDGL